MKNIILTLLSLLFICSVSYSQIKVNANGKVTAGNSMASTIVPVADFTVPGNFLNRANASFGGYAIQSVANTNGFISMNGYYSNGNWVYPKSGRTSMSQFYNGGVIMYTGPSIAANGSIPAGNLTTTLHMQPSGNMSIGYPYAHVSSARLDVNGSILHQGTVMMSDKRLKGNIKPLQLGLNEVMQINTISYNYLKETGMDSETSHIGVIAQELQKIAPELVVEIENIERVGDQFGDSDDLKTVSKGSKLGVKDSEIQYMLINAIKDQQDIIEKLTAQVNALEVIITGNDVAGNESEIELGVSTSSSLMQNIPNPYTDNTSIEYNVEGDKGSMNFYDLNGKLIKSIQLNSGKGRINVKASELPNGTYTYNLVVDGKLVNAKKMVVTK